MNNADRDARVRVADVMIAKVVQAFAEAGAPVRFESTPQSGDKIPSYSGVLRGRLVAPCGGAIPFTLFAPNGGWRPNAPWMIVSPGYDKDHVPATFDGAEVAQQLVPRLVTARALHASKAVADRIMATVIPQGTAQMRLDPCGDGTLRITLSATVDEAQIATLIKAARAAKILE